MKDRYNIIFSIIQKTKNDYQENIVFLVNVAQT